MVMKEFTEGERLFAADLNDNFDETQLAGNILSGTLAADRIPNLNASKITAGVLAGARIPIKGIGSNVVQTVKTDTFTTASTVFVNVTGLTAAITPSSNTSKVLVIVSFTLSSTGSRGAGNSFGVSVRLRRGSTAIYLGATASARTRASAGISPFSNTDYFGNTLVFLDSPATASSATYGMQIAHPTNTQGQNAVIGRSGADTNNSASSRVPSSITLIEVAA